MYRKNCQAAPAVRSNRRAAQCSSLRAEGQPPAIPAPPRPRHYVRDSPLEEDGFEPSVPLDTTNISKNRLASPASSIRAADHAARTELELGRGQYQFYLFIQARPSYLPHFLPPFGARRDHVTGGKATVTKVGRAGSAPAGYFATNRQIHGGSSRPERSDSRDRDLGEKVDALCAIDDLPARPSVRRRWRDLSPPTAMDRAALSKR